MKLNPYRKLEVADDDRRADNLLPMTLAHPKLFPT